MCRVQVTIGRKSTAGSKLLMRTSKSREVATMEARESTSGVRSSRRDGCRRFSEAIRSTPDGIAAVKVSRDAMPPQKKLE